LAAHSSLGHYLPSILWISSVKEVKGENKKLPITVSSTVHFYVIKNLGEKGTEFAITVSNNPLQGTLLDRQKAAHFSLKVFL
jgi:hypothetical protein